MQILAIGLKILIKSVYTHMIQVNKLFKAEGASFFIRILLHLNLVLTVGQYKDAKTGVVCLF